MVVASGSSRGDVGYVLKGAHLSSFQIVCSS